MVRLRDEEEIDGGENEFLQEEEEKEKLIKDEIMMKEKKIKLRKTKMKRNEKKKKKKKNLEPHWRRSCLIPLCLLNKTMRGNLPDSGV